MQNDDTTRKKIRTVLRIHRTLGFVWRASPGAALFSGALVLIQGLFPLALLYLVKLIVDEAARVMQSAGGASAESSGGPELTWLFILVGAAAGISLLQAAFRQAGELASETLSLKVSDHIYDRLHRKSTAVDLAFYENPSYFDTLHRAQMEGPHRPAKIVNSLVSIGRDGVSLAAVLGLLLYFHPVMPLILFAAVIPGVWVKIRFSRIMYQWQRDRTGTQREASYLNWLITGYIHAKELRLFSLGGFFSQWFSGLRTILRAEKLDITKKRCIAEVWAQFVSVAAMFGALGFIVFRAAHGMITIGDLVMYYQAIQRGLTFFQGLLSNMTSLYEDNLFISYFYEFMDIGETVTDPSEPTPMPETISRGISVENLSFAYPQASAYTLEDITFTIAPGEVVALVGENGAGKSTLTRLLCRLYDPAAGRIAIDGIDIRGFRLEELRSKIGVMFQDFARYHFTARMNIWIGSINAPSRDETVREAAKKAEADNFIQKLPRGYDTILGKMFESGEELSGGQWQKVALARAFMRDAELIILDEPASSLDADSEYEIFKNFRALFRGKSAVLVSHRFSTVKMADRIIMLQNGRITEQGSHAELLAHNGAYARWFETQAMVAGLQIGGHHTVFG